MFQNKNERKAEKIALKAKQKERESRTELEWYAEWRETDMCCIYSIWRSMQGCPIKQ